MSNRRDAHEKELERIVREYERRTAELDPEMYSLSKPANLFTRQSQVRAVTNALKCAGKSPFSSLDFLEVGCGRGEWLWDLERVGLRRSRLHGIELVESFASTAQARMPGVDVRLGDAASLPWEGGSFDVAFQSTVFTSILDESVKAKVASEMRRVLKPGGIVLWYDFTFDNPKNKQVKGIKQAEIRRLFPGANSYAFERTTLAPPIARWLVGRSWLVAALLESARVLNTHCVATIAY